VIEPPFDRAPPGPDNREAFFDGIDPNRARGRIFEREYFGCGFGVGALVAARNDLEKREGEAIRREIRKLLASRLSSLSQQRQNSRGPFRQTSVKYVVI